MSDHVDTLRGDLERLDRRIRNTEDAWLDHRVIDARAHSENLKSLRALRDLMHRDLENAIAREEAEADLNHGGDAA